MSNREHPCTGFVLEVSKLVDFLSADQRPSFDEAMEDHDFTKALQILHSAMPPAIASPSEIFILSDTDTGNELETDVPYALFDEEDLYETVERSELVGLQCIIGEAPVRHSWSIWG